MSELNLETVRSLLQTMIVSSEVYVDSEGTVIGYQIKTGALHKLVGLFANTDSPLIFPNNLPTTAVLLDVSEVIHPSLFEMTQEEFEKGCVDFLKQIAIMKSLKAIDTDTSVGSVNLRLIVTKR